MEANDTGDVTQAIAMMRQGDDDAVTRLWEVCYPSAVVHAKRKLGGIPDRLVSPDEVAASAFRSVWREMVSAPCDDMLRSADLWRYIHSKVKRKAIDRIRGVNAQKRGGGRVATESELGEADMQVSVFIDQCDDPAFQKEFTITIDEFFDFLPTELQTVASLLLTFSLSNEELASILQCSLRSVQRKVKGVLEHASRFHDLGGSSTH